LRDDRRPSLSLKDDRAARNAAIRDGLAKARVEADAFAVALDLKVLRMTAVDNIGQTSGWPGDTENLMLTIAGMQGGGGSNDVTTTVKVGVDFELGPR
jgi:uncharacterized protein